MPKATRRLSAWLLVCLCNCLCVGLISALAAGATSNSTPADEAARLVAAPRVAESDADTEAIVVELAGLLGVPILNPNDDGATAGLYPAEIAILAHSFRQGNLTSLDELILQWKQAGMQCGASQCTPKLMPVHPLPALPTTFSPTPSPKPATIL